MDSTSSILEGDTSSERNTSLLKNMRLVKLLVYILLITTAGTSVTIIMPSLSANYFGDCLNTKGHIIDDECKPNFPLSNLWSNIFESIGGLLQFCFVGLVGRLTDGFGRKLFLYLQIISFMLPRCFLIFYVDILIYYILYLPVNLFSSSYTSLAPFVSGYIADILHEKRRTSGFGIAYAVKGVSVLFGTGFALIISSIFNNLAIFPALMIFYGVNIIYTYFFIPESLPKNNRKPFTTKHYNPFKPLLQINKNRLIFWCVMESLFFGIIEAAVTTSGINYTLNELNIESDNEVNQMVAIILVGIGISSFLCNSVILPQFKKCGFTNFQLLLFIQMVASIGFIQSFIFGILDDSYTTIRYILAYLLTITVGLQFMHGPVISGIITQCITKNEQGVTFGMLNAYKGIINIITPWSFAYLYIYLISQTMGYLLFPLLSIFLLIAFLITIIPLKNSMYDFNHSMYLKQEENYGSNICLQPQT